jgi:hypothetical protein
MSTEMSIVELKNVTDAQVVWINSASFQGSKPFQGMFQVHDVDHCWRDDHDASKNLLLVRCNYGDTPDHQDAYLEFESTDLVWNTLIGYEGPVVARFALTQPSN